MKRVLRIFTTLILAATGCGRFEETVPVAPVEDGAPMVSVVFSVNMPDVGTATRVMDSEPDVRNLRLAVFGASGFLKNYVLAEPVEPASQNYDAGAGGPVYSYKVSLPLSEGMVSIHFIANGPENLPFKYEDEVMGSLTTSGNQDAYWQKVVLPQGIRALKYIDGDGIEQYRKDENNNYILDPSSVTEMSLVSLVRNFAWISVETVEGSNFELKKFAIGNIPDSGTVAPYSGSGFLVNYQDYDIDWLKANYSGHMSAATTINSTVPGAGDFVDASEGLYMYERTSPASSPTYIIVYGSYNGGADSYYRIDLQSGGDYFAVYRNFRYRITIRSVAKNGSPTPEEAAAISGGSDISAAIETAGMNDISDGTSRLLVEYTEKTIVHAGQVTLKFKYYPDVFGNPGVCDNDRVTITKVSHDASGPVITGDISIGQDDDSFGWRTLSFNAPAPGAEVKNETIKVLGTPGVEGSQIYRLVNFHLINIQSMTVNCVPDEVESLQGQAVDVEVTIPKGLPASIFPLDFSIEAEKMTLTPFNDNLPVQSGVSRIPGKNNRSFWFSRLLTYEEYVRLSQGDDGDVVTFVSHFKTNREQSASKIYVFNEFFSPACDEFFNYALLTFSNLNYSTSEMFGSQVVFEGEGSPVDFSFDMDPSEPVNEVTVTLSGLAPAGTETRLVPVANLAGTYKYQPENANTNVLNLVTTTDDTPVGVALSARHYKGGSLSAGRGLLDFVNPYFSRDEYPSAGGLDAAFIYAYLDSCLEVTKVTMTGARLKDVNPVSGGSYELVSADPARETYVYRIAATAVQPVLNLVTTGQGDISIKLEADGYNTVTVTVPRVRYRFVSPRFHYGLVPESAGMTAKVSFDYAADWIAPTSVTLTGLAPGGFYQDNTVTTWVDADGTWTLSGEYSSSGTNTFIFIPSGSASTSRSLDLVTTNSGGTVSCVLGSIEEAYEPVTLSATQVPLTFQNGAGFIADNSFVRGYVVKGAGKAVKASFNYQPHSSNDGVWNIPATVTLTGLKPAGMTTGATVWNDENGTWTIVNSAAGIYRYTPAAGRTSTANTVNLVTTTYSDAVSVTLSTEDEAYTPVTFSAQRKTFKTVTLNTNRSTFGNKGTSYTYEGVTVSSFSISSWNNNYLELNDNASDKTGTFTVASSIGKILDINVTCSQNGMMTPDSGTMDGYSWTSSGDVNTVLFRTRGDSYGLFWIRYYNTRLTRLVVTIDVD